MLSYRKLTLSITGIILFTILAGTASSVRAQEEDKAEPPCSEVLKVSLDKFVESYSSKPGHRESEAYDIYKACKAKDNDKRLLRLPAKNRAQIAGLRKSLDKWVSAVYGMCWSKAGGGSIYAQMQRANEAEREIRLAEVIGVMEGHRKRGNDSTSHMRSNLNSFLLKTRRAYPLLAKRTEYEADVHARSFREFKSETARLKTQLRALPSITLNPLLKYVNQTLDFLLEEHKP